MGKKGRDKRWYGDKDMRIKRSVLRLFSCRLLQDIRIYVKYLVGRWVYESGKSRVKTTTQGLPPGDGSHGEIE